MTEKETLEFLREPLLLRLGMIDADGYPIVQPVWFIYEDEKFLIVSERKSKKVDVIKNNGSVYFVIDRISDETGPCGVRGKGDARIIDAPAYVLEVAEKQLLRYVGSLDGELAKKMLASANDMVVVEIRPKFLGTWRQK
jgi:nitroimidazol reductase NimA-like FMN-containing flavoprotein (pyridoxamine 5'-phosphate oxidase superfamily)